MDAVHRMMFLAKGQVVDDDRPDVIFNQPRVPRTRQFLQAVLSV